MFEIKECAQAKAQPRPVGSFQRYERNAEISDFSPYEIDRPEVKVKNNSSFSVDESKLKVLLLHMISCLPFKI